MKKSIVIFILFVSSVFLISTALADMNDPPDADASGTSAMTGHHGSKMGKGHKMEKGPDLFRGIGGITLEELMKLNLTDAQKKDVANILAAHKETYRKNVDRMTDAQKVFFDTIHSKDIPDESAVRNAHKKMSAIMEELIVEKIQIMSAMKQVLTADQFDRLRTNDRGGADDQRHVRNKARKRLKGHREMMDTWITTYADTGN